MNTATWKSIKSPVMQEIRQLLKKKTVPNEPTPSRKESNRIWREEILGIMSEDQKTAAKIRKQQKAKKTRIEYDEDE
jgi:hypothetical protein